ncbi:hypothetical protein AJ79_04815 [Helicocarpus griseus UAMH5409]|uniref:Fucose-specific lectin n=1 Tax=Helicocarpus griseus UAMH5409 TaxID=1447875 RepID=A0A2B7XSV1_9EURO|nr:hypothetical protein AJ79_04815 [Helicocarpus griseus UAMH5409]
MGEAKLPIGEYRKLTGCWTSEEQIALFFENSTGQLQRLSVDAKGWKILNQAAARREEASPFVAMACSFQTVTLFYCHEDKHLHRLTIDLKNDTCNDNIQQGTRFRAIPADIMVVQADNDDIWTYILKGDDEPPGMYEIGPHGERAVIGETFERNPVPSTLFSGKTKMIRIQGGQRN